MFLEDYLKKRSELKKEYHSISDLVYEAINITNKETDGNLGSYLEVGENNTLMLKYKIDERLSVTVILSCLDHDHHEVVFYINDIAIDTDDLESYRKIADELAYDLEHKLKTYQQKRKSVVDDYIKWKEENK